MSNNKVLYQFLLENRSPNNDGRYHNPVTHDQPPSSLAMSRQNKNTNRVRKHHANNNNNTNIWSAAEMRHLISLRHEFKHLFNSTAVHIHLWEAIARRMRKNGWRRTGTMCFEKFQQILKWYRQNYFPANNRAAINKEWVPENDRIPDRVISVTYQGRTQMVALAASGEAIKDAVKSVFAIRSNQAVWLRDENDIIWEFDTNMPTKAYTLHVDQGITMKFCVTGNPCHAVCQVMEHTFYVEEDFAAFLGWHGWYGVVKAGSNKVIKFVDELKANEVYHGLLA